MNIKKVKKSSIKNNEKFMKDKISKERTRCEIYTRVMWYHRPVSSYNIWKKSEFFSRTYFEIWYTNNEFTKKSSLIVNCK